MEWIGAVNVALNISGVVYIALKNLELQDNGASREVQWVSTQLGRLEKTISTIQADCERPSRTEKGSNAQIWQIRKDLGLLKDVLDEPVALPTWKFGVTMDSSVTVQARKSRNFLDILEQVKRATLQTLHRWDGDKKQLRLNDLFAFASNLEGIESSIFPIFPIFTRNPLQEIQANRSTRLGNKRKPQICPADEAPPCKKRCVSASASSSGVQMYPQRPQTRSMTKKQQGFGFDCTESTCVSNEHQHRQLKNDLLRHCRIVHTNTEQKSLLSTAHIHESPSSSRGRNYLREQLDQLKYENDQLLREIAQLQTDLENDIAEIG